ncbi:hypothetical protein EDD18DRAFT_1330459 [Armillaria luteobubalina]|uniref:Protein kinase domain-containing protein n=1 Tax=Armillaria luteobubalina TaxID=153913 RepID=A0AA39UPS7_9AGAR|nr:hypothetical protein EDD18DRAFT_1330459 [Armillaria luteobubalina]
MYTKKDMIKRLESWDLDRKTLILSMWDNLPELAIWDMYALSGQSVLEDMSVYEFSSHIAARRVKVLWEIAPVPSGDRVPAGGKYRPSTSQRKTQGSTISKKFTPSFPKKKPTRSFEVKEPSATSKIALHKSRRGTTRYKANVADFIQRVYEAQVSDGYALWKGSTLSKKEQKAKAHHEYAIYRRLLYGPVPVSAGDIPTAFGFLEDVESDTGALIMSYNGQPLAHRADPLGSGMTVSLEERATLLRILESIHAAGVAHGDIRTWNMVADGEGRLSIIDFDRANEE